MEDISIFAIPHLRDEVTQYLTRCDLAQCSLVSKQWSSWFTPILWHTINRRHPQIESSTLIKYRDHIRELIGVDIAFASKDDLWPLPNLRRLEIYDGLKVYHTVEPQLKLLRLLQMTELFILQTLKIGLLLHLESVQIQLFETLLHLPQLKKLDLESRKYAPPIYTQQLIQTCSHLDSLTLSFGGYDEDSTERSMAGCQTAKRAMELMPETRLRELECDFEFSNLEMALLPSLLTRCPLLESNAFDISSSELDVEIVRSLSRKSDSNYTGNDTWDRERQCGLETFAQSFGYFGDLMAPALVEYHSATLTSLKVSWPGICSTDLGTLLSGLPRLRSLHNILEAIREQHINTMTNRCMHYIFEQVGRLTELEEWTLGRKFEQLYLSGGFLIWLSGLKRMKSLVYRARTQDQQLDVEEAKWMIENWPALIHIVLRCVKGNNLTNEGHQAEDQFKATLKKRRPWIHIE
ncbi:hypothetical protein BC939DRAFT_529183 [Gamsiella multidivaricata]|uniref:uncharacterized protein n=1 Tax=Gamsiella multidivaricata TaxID=101098 RepID=UPI00221F90D6|nr:uncharacterized protein BC939DRAFT_529183 [Gamsiella multidivaricata]KAI7822988.1 hypothetical protein BC939DRAFT_529183 [Gamsiella multidivaricata]